MELRKLFCDIEMIYEEFKYNFPIDDIVIVSNDNYYNIFKNNISIKISKEYNLVNMWSDNPQNSTTHYTIEVYVGNQTYSVKKTMIEFTYKLITPLLRESKLNKLKI
jgi:hypothetical protein